MKKDNFKYPDISIQSENIVIFNEFKRFNKN